MVKAGGSLYLGLALLAVAAVAVGVTVLSEGRVLAGVIPVLLGLGLGLSMAWFYRLPVSGGQKDFDH